jgi:hypothetical protein
MLFEAWRILILPKYVASDRLELSNLVGRDKGVLRIRILTQGVSKQLQDKAKLWKTEWVK